jgi:hypothetical protein
MGDRAAKSRARGASPAAQPSSVHLGLRRLCASAWDHADSTGDEASVSRLGLLDPSTLLIAMALDIVGVDSAFLAALGLVSRLQF